MATLNEMLRASTDLDSPDREWLHLLVGDWQLISDLAFADLELPIGHGEVMLAPKLQARIAQEVALRPGDRVLVLDNGVNVIKLK